MYIVLYAKLKIHQNLIKNMTEWLKKMETNYNLNFGWTCPKCGRTYSPFTQMCYYCNDVRTMPVVNTTGTVSWKYQNDKPTADSAKAGDFPSEPTARDILHEEGYPIEPMNII